MKIAETLTDDAALTELGRRLQRARLDRRMTQADLAAAAGVARATIERFEASGVAQTQTLVRILRALGLLDRLDVVAPDVTAAPIEALETRGRGRRRARHPRTPRPPATPWTWGDQR